MIKAHFQNWNLTKNVLQVEFALLSKSGKYIFFMPSNNKHFQSSMLAVIANKEENSTHQRNTDNTFHEGLYKSKLMSRGLKIDPEMPQ